MSKKGILWRRLLALSIVITTVATSIQLTPNTAQAHHKGKEHSTSKLFSHSLEDLSDILSPEVAESVSPEVTQPVKEEPETEKNFIGDGFEVKVNVTSCYVILLFNT